jgi:hypothetical protein
MKLDELKSAWKDITVTAKTNEEVLLMLTENKHPVLRKIRKQLALECIAYLIFLLCYYTMFDGGTRPLFINLLLVASVLFPLIHNLTGYRIAKYLINGTAIRESIQHYYKKMKRYAFISICSRVLFMSGLVLFFTYGLHLKRDAYFSLAGMMLIFLVQLFLLYRLWSKRLHQIGITIGSLTDQANQDG